MGQSSRIRILATSSLTLFSNNNRSSRRQSRSPPRFPFLHLQLLLPARLRSSFVLVPRRERPNHPSNLSSSVPSSSTPSSPTSLSVQPITPSAMVSSSENTRYVEHWTLPNQLSSPSSVDWNRTTSPISIQSSRVISSRSTGLTSSRISPTRFFPSTGNLSLTPIERPLPSRPSYVEEPRRIGVWSIRDWSLE